MKLLLLLFLLFGCKQKNVLEGTYQSELLNTQTYYEFKKNEVNVKLIVSGMIVLNENGTYVINDEADEITFVFDDVIESYDLEGSFTFKEKDDSIMIGLFEFEKK